jgi:splicing factor 3B subunit 3
LHEPALARPALPISPFPSQLVHRTPIEDIPTRIVPCWGRVLVGVGRTLRMYDLGLKRLLRKCEARGFPGPLTSIVVSMDRVFVGDANESVSDRPCNAHA